MLTDNIIAGAYETNCYILRKDKDAKDCVIIDTALESRPIINFLQENKLNPAVLVLTHGHIDHIAAIPAIKELWPEMKVYIHEADAEMLVRPTSNLSPLAGKMFKTEPADKLLKDGEEINIAGISLKVLHTPGHTAGGICLYSKKANVVFAGDTLFQGSVGRTDFPGSSTEKLMSSIKEKLLVLPDETVVYTGHGEETSIGEERRYNPFLR